VHFISGGGRDISAASMPAGEVFNRGLHAISSNPETCLGELKQTGDLYRGQGQL